MKLSCPHDSLAFQGNVLVNRDRRALLTDFGLARSMGDAPSGLTTSRVSMSTRYASPEQVKKNSRGTLESDVWSWACLLMEVSNLNL